MKFGEILTYETKHKAVIGNYYLLSDCYADLLKIRNGLMENDKTLLKLNKVGDGIEYPFGSSCGMDYDFALEVLDSDDKSVEETTEEECNDFLLRDSFALSALQGLLANADYEMCEEDEVVARKAYKLADAMLAERAKGEKK